MLVADLSFISLVTVAPVLAGALARPGADVVVLVKPQFEAGRAEVSRGKGVIRDPAVRRGALEKVASAFASQGATIMGAMASPLLGPAGNAEFLLHVRTGTAPGDVSAAAAGSPRPRPPCSMPPSRRCRRRATPGASGRGACTRGSVAAVATIAFVVHPERPDAAVIARQRRGLARGARPPRRRGGDPSAPPDDA